MNFKEMQKEIDFMAESFESDFDADLESTQAPGTESISTDAPGTDSPGTDAPTTEAPVIEDDPRDLEIQKLKEEMEKLKNPEPESTDVPSTEMPIEDIDFLDGMSVEDLNEENLNKLLNKVHKEGIKVGQDISKRELNEVKNAIPTIAQNARKFQEESQAMIKEFYDNNKDLEKWKSAVSVVFQDIAAANPGKSYKEVLPMVADEARKRLNIKKSSQSKDDDPPPPPSTGKKGKRKTADHKPSEFELEIDAMENALNL